MAYILDNGFRWSAKKVVLVPIFTDFTILKGRTRKQHEFWVSLKYGVSISIHVLSVCITDNVCVKCF